MQNFHGIRNGIPVHRSAEFLGEILKHRDLLPKPILPAFQFLAEERNPDFRRGRSRGAWFTAAPHRPLGQGFPRVGGCQ